MKEKVFGFTRGELVEMFEPYSEFEERVNEETYKYGFGMITSTPDFMKNCCVWLQDKIETSRMSKIDKINTVDMIGSLLDMVFKAGRVYQIKESGGLDNLVKEMADARIAEHQER